MPVFDRHGDPRGEPDGIDRVEPVADGVARHVALVDDGTVVQICLALHTPRVVEVVLRARAVKARWPGVVVDEDHLVALAPPAALTVVDGEVATDVLP